MSAITTYRLPPGGVPGHVVAELTMVGHRAATHLIRTPSGELVVHKRFQRGCEANFQREVAALRSLKQIDLYDVIPPVLEVGNDFFIIPYYADVLCKNTLLYRCGFRLMPLRVVRRVFNALGHFYAHGYEILEMYPHHVLADATGKVALIDLEYAYPGAADPRVPYEHSQTIHGALPDFPDDVPRSVMYYPGRYEWYWGLYTGLPLASVLHDPAWLQRTKRAVFTPWLLSRAVWRRARKRANPARSMPSRRHILERTNRG